MIMKYIKNGKRIKSFAKKSYKSWQAKQKEKYAKMRKKKMPLGGDFPFSYKKPKSLFSAISSAAQTEANIHAVARRMKKKKTRTRRVKRRRKSVKRKRRRRR